MIGMDSPSLSLADLLLQSIGLRWLDPLASLGAHTFDDLTYLTEEDLHGIGMRIVDIRRLSAALSAAIQSDADWNYDEAMAATHGLPTPHPPGSQPPSRLELAILEQAMAKAEQDAIQFLGIIEAGSEMVDYAVTARVHLSEPSRTTISAISAENAIVRALSQGPQGATRKALQKAELCIRDIIVLRTQVLVPLASRSRFIEELKEAYGELPTGKFEKLMHTHSKVVCPLFPYTFVSNSCRENAARRHGPRGKRTRDLRRAAALSAPPGLDLPR